MYTFHKFKLPLLYSSNAHTWEKPSNVHNAWIGAYTLAIFLFFLATKKKKFVEAQ